MVGIYYYLLEYLLRNILINSIKILRYIFKPKVYNLNKQKYITNKININVIIKNNKKIKQLIILGNNKIIYFINLILSIKILITINEYLHNIYKHWN